MPGLPGDSGQAGLTCMSHQPDDPVTDLKRCPELFARHEECAGGGAGREARWMLLEAGLRRGQKDMHLFNSASLARRGASGHGAGGVVSLSGVGCLGS